MVDAFFIELILLNHLIDNRCQVSGISGSTNLIKDYFQGIFIRCELSHCFYEVLPIRGIKPGGTKDKIMTAGFLYAMLTSQLRFTIHTQRISFPIFPTRDISVSLKNIVRRDMYQGSISFFCYNSQILHCLIIQ